MIIYPWNENTKIALPKTQKANNHPNPIGRNETDVPPPTSIPTDHVARAVLTNEGWFKSWEVVMDKRGTDYWNQDGTKHSITDLDCDIPAGSLIIPPPSPFHTTHNGTTWVIDVPMMAESRRQERDAMISGTYSPAIQQLTRWVDNNREVPKPLAYYTRQRDAWHAWADALCALPDQPGFPWPEGEVPWPEQPPRPTPYDATNKG